MMNEKRFTLEQWTEESLYFSDGEYSAHMSIAYICKKVEKKLNEQQDKITELEIELTDCKNRKEQLEYKNTKLIAKIDFLERVIDGDV